MPSQEEYLNQLLQGIEEPHTESAEVESAVIEDPIEEEATIEDLIADMPVMEESVIEDLIADIPVMEESEIADLASENSGEDILKKMVLENATIEDVLQEDAIPESDIMSEEDVEKLLAANQEEADMATEASILTNDEELMSLLEESSDNELQDIFELLQKSDNNEVIDEDLLSFQSAEGNLDEAAKLQAELDAMEDNIGAEQPDVSERQKKAQEKKRLKEEKAEAKRAAKEAKKAEKEAKKAAKKAAKDVSVEVETTDALSTEDMMDLQDLLAVGDVSSEATVPNVQQTAQIQSEPVVVDMAQMDVLTAAPTGSEDAMSADMLEIDELLSLAGISGVAQEPVANVESVDSASVEALFDEDSIEEKTSEKDKKGLFTRILDFLTETDEEDEKGIEDIPLSDENKNILEEMDKEEKSSGKKKSKKAKKGKKGQKEQADIEALGDEDLENEAAKGKKAKKAKKPKKEKEKHLDVAPVDGPKGKLPVKALICISMLCASVLAVVLLLVNLGGDFAVKREAKKAYYQEDYETCYQTLYGKKLNESEQVMFAKSESILRIRLRMRQYEMFAEEQSEVEALDVLIQTVYDYADLYEYASKWNAAEEVSSVYSQMLAIMQDKYHLTEGDALEIAAVPNDVDYTKLVTAIAEGEQYHSVNEEKVESAETVKLPDMLPEESKFPENNGGQ